jgi:hypothetical protein
MFNFVINVPKYQLIPTFKVTFKHLKLCREGDIAIIVNPSVPHTRNYIVKGWMVGPHVEKSKDMRSTFLMVEYGPHVIAN